MTSIVKERVVTTLFGIGVACMWLAVNSLGKRDELVKLVWNMSIRRGLSELMKFEENGRIEGHGGVFINQLRRSPP